jgi:uncharacterized protein (TIGR02145 family)
MLTRKAFVGIKKTMFLSIAVFVIALIVGCFSSNHSNSFIDNRDGQRYRTITIGNQVWMAENLNYKDKKSWCYDDKKYNCKKYGRLYEWEAAVKACPNDWHLPSNAEWDQLINESVGKELAGKMLKSEMGWGGVANLPGTDEFRFSALPGGCRVYDDGGFYYVGYYGRWWSASKDSGGYAYLRFMGYNHNYVIEGSSNRQDGLSVRCVLGRSGR